jgi:GNAT superfamily N-acetyltransferase
VDDVVIREFAAGDREEMMALASRLTEGVAPWRDPAAVLAAVQGWVSSSADAADQDGHAVFVAVAGDQLAGFVTVTQRKHFSGQIDGYIGELVTAPGRERRGIARRLVGVAEQWAHDRGLDFITLGTGAANNGARAFYAALGYQEEDVQLTRELRTSTTDDAAV